MTATLQKIDKMLRTSKQNLNNITKTTEKFREEEKTYKEYINGRMEHTTLRNNKDTNNISKLEKQKATSDPLESKAREQSDTKNVQKGE